MPRPREFDEDTALDAATAQFWSHGYEATSVRDLAATMGLTAASLYNAFGDKRTLYDHLRRRYAGEFSEHVVDRYCVAGTPEECVARVREYLDAGARHVVFNLAELEDAERLAEVARAAAG